MSEKEHRGVLLNLASIVLNMFYSLCCQGSRAIDFFLNDIPNLAFFVLFLLYFH